MKQFTNELSFDRPPGLFDRTHHIFTVAEDGPSPFTVVISKTRVANELLEEMADRIVVELSRTLDDFALASRGPAVVGGRNGTVLQFEWKQAGETLRQKQVAMIHEAADGRFLLQITATATGAATAEQLAMLDTVLASAQFRELAPTEAGVV